LAPGTYSLIFDSDYLDLVNSIHYSVFDTVGILISGATPVNEEYDYMVSVYPVPVSDCLIVENVRAGCTYEIFDLNGHLRASGNAGEGFISIADLMSGGYILRIIMDGNAILSKRIVVTR